MRMVITGDDFPVKKSAGRGPGKHAGQPQVECVYLSESTRHAARAAGALSSAGIRLHHVARVEDALSCTAFAGPMVLLMDVDSATSDYKRTLEKLVRHAPGISIVAVTDSAQPSWEAVVLAGGYDVIRRPFEPAELIHVVMGAYRCAEICSDSEASLRRRECLMAAIRESLRVEPAVQTAPLPAPGLASRIAQRLRGLLPQRLSKK